MKDFSAAIKAIKEAAEIQKVSEDKVIIEIVSQYAAPYLKSIKEG